MMRIWRSTRHFVIRHSSAGWNPLKNKKILLVYGLLGLPLLAIGGSSYALFLAGGTGPAASVGSINLQQGLVGWWKLDGNANDSTPYRDNGTIYGSTISADQRGESNQALCYNGTSSDYVNIPDSPALDPTTQESVSIWFKATATGNLNGSIVYNKENQIEASAGGGYFTYAFMPSWAWYGGTSFPVTVGQWYNAVVTYDGTNQYLYDNGKLVYTHANSGAIPTTTNRLALATRGYSGGGSSPFNGCEDDMRIYNRALSPAEVTALYNQYDPSLNADAGQSGLIGEWKLNGNANDSSPNHNNGTITGTVTATTDREGKANGAMSFNGSASYITVPDSNILSPSAITATAWVYPVSNAGSGNIVSKGGNLEYRYRINSTGTVTAFDRGGTNNITTTQTVPLNQWSMVSFTGDSTGLKIYINGQLSTSGGAAYAPPNSASPLWIGAYQSNGEYFDGSIEDLRIYDRALSASEISDLYNSYNSQVTVSNLQSGLVGDWAFNGNANDSTPYRDNGTVNGATLTTDREGRANSAYAFNGSSNYISVPNETQFNTGSVSVSLWLDLSAPLDCDGNNNWRGLINKGSPANTQSGWDLMIEEALGVHWDIGYGGATHRIYSGTGSLSVGVPVFITATYDANSGQADIYMNDILKGSATLTSPITTNSYGIVIGTGGNYSTCPPGAGSIPGTIDDVRIWNRALSATEVQALYNEYN